MKLSTCGISLLVLVLATCSGAQTPPSPAAPSTPDVLTVSTKHVIKLAGVDLAYTATAGTIPIKSDDNEVEGRMFYVAYTKDGAAPGTRPLIFAYNGGPGSSSTWLHLGALGPQRAAMRDDGTMPAPPYHVVDNQETWLPDADIVMVDAMGTGYSRLTKPEFGKNFYGINQDVRAFSEFIRAYLTANQRYSSPLFVCGESYGGIRSAGLAGRLLEKGIALSGVIIISGTMNFGTLDSSRGNDTPYVGFLPSLAATAWYHKRLSPRSQGSLKKTVAEVEAFAEGEYANALHRGTSLSAKESDHIASKLSEYIGVSKRYALQSHLRVSEFRFFKELLREEGKTVGRLDSRLTGTDSLQVGDSPDYDASDAAVTPVFNSCINDYLARDLQVKTDLVYRITGYGNIGEWDSPKGGYADTSESLRTALVQNPYMKVMFACGYYDLACPHFATHYSVNHMDLEAKQLANISWSYYPAGHMMYIEKSSREKLHKDVALFIQSAIKS